MVHRNNAGRLGAGFISVCLETVFIFGQEHTKGAVRHRGRSKSMSKRFRVYSASRNIRHCKRSQCVFLIGLEVPA